MRNQPSNQSRDSGSWRSKSPSRQTACSRPPTEEEQRSSSSVRTSRMADINTESHFKYVPSTRSSQKQYFSRNADGYEKPCLPYYVVPVLYVPQKVLSSEEIRPSSSTNKNTMSFVLKDRKESKEGSTINIDDIPCIPCELAKRTKQNTDNYEKEEILINDVNLDPSCTGYINTCYTQSSTSLIEDAPYQDDAIPNQTTKKCANQEYVQYENTYYRKANQPNRRQDPAACQRFPQQRQRFANTQRNRIDSYQLPKSNVRVRWNPECNCYETVEEIIVPDGICRGYQRNENRRMYAKNRNFVPTSELQKIRASKQPNDRVLQQGCYQQTCYRKKQNYIDEQRCRDAEAGNNYQAQLNRQAMQYQDDIDQLPFQDDYTQYEGLTEQSSILSCGKATKLVKEVSSLIGTPYSCEPDPEVEMMRSSQRHSPTPAETYTIEPVHLHLGEDSVLSVTPMSRRNKKPKESQTAFDEGIDSTYVATDEPLRETKSTQTMDAGTTSVSTSTQTNRALRTFETCPPPYIEQIGEDIGVISRPRTRETSPSPTRYRRTPSPIKQYPGDAKKMTIMKTAEMLQKPVTNQVSSTCPLKQHKSKRRKLRTSLSPG